MSRLTGIDFSKFDLDEPLPTDLTTNGHQSSLAKWIGKTPRSIAAAATPARAASTSPARADHVAGMMQEIMEEVGGDGFLIFNSYFDRRYVMEVCDGLVPELQRRGADAQGLCAQAPARTICWSFRRSAELDEVRARGRLDLDAGVLDDLASI